MLWRHRGTTHVFRLQPQSVIGRESDAVVRVSLPEVSRQHARISFEDGLWWLEGLSPAGTFLNRALVVREKLRHLDVVTLGRDVNLVFVLQATDAGAHKMTGIVSAALHSPGGDLPEGIPLGSITLGRAASNNIVVNAEAVSKIHAEIQRTRTQLVLRDLESSNGTFVNGVRTTASPLKDGDILVLGKVARYKVVVEYGEVEQIDEIPITSEETSTSTGTGWKTRYDWDSGEMRGLEEFRKRLDAEDARRKKEKGSGKPDAPGKAVKLGPNATLPPPAAKPAPVGPHGTMPPPLDAVADGPKDPPPAPPRKPPVAPPPVAPPAAAVSGHDPTSNSVAVPAYVDSPPPGTVPAVPAPAAPARSAAPAAPDAPAAPTILPGQAVPGPRPAIELRLTGEGVNVTLRDPGRYELGRAAAIALPNATVSRLHAWLIIPKDAPPLIEHAGGSSWTKLNGTNVSRSAPLKDGDVLELGELSLAVAIRQL